MNFIIIGILSILSVPKSNFWSNKIPLGLSLTVVSGLFLAVIGLLTTTFFPGIELTSVSLIMLPISAVLFLIYYSAFGATTENIDLTLLLIAVVIGLTSFFVI